LQALLWKKRERREEEQEELRLRCIERLVLLRKEKTVTACLFQNTRVSSIL